MFGHPSPFKYISQCTLLQPVIGLSLLGIACGNADSTPPGGKPTTTSQSASNSVATTSAANTASAKTPSITSAATSASASVNSPRKAPSIKQVTSELKKKCLPTKEGTTNVEIKQQFSDTNDCMKKILIAELDTVLLPLKKSDPTKFKALMAEQATWNRAIEPSCQVEEEEAWLNFDDGSRSDGTMRGYAFLGCLDTATTERVLYAKALAANDATGLAKRIEEVQANGAKVKAYLQDRHNIAAKWVMVPPKESPDTIIPDWKAFYGNVATIQKNTVALAHSTCGLWPELAKALGGTESCEKKAELYYYLQGNSPPEEK